MKHGNDIELVRPHVINDSVWAFNDFSDLIHFEFRHFAT